jgi:single-strand DNA-binding protein
VNGVAVTVVGNLVADPRLRYTRDGRPWCTFRVAVTRRPPSGSTRTESTVFLDVMTFGQMAENVAESLQKGARAFVSGVLEEDTWVGSDGRERRSSVILADVVGPDLRFATAQVTRNPRPDAAGRSTADAAARAAAEAGHDPFAPLPNGAEEVPF